MFNNYKEYVNFYKKYLNNVDDRLIKTAILRTTKRGQIIVFKGLCDRIIIKEKAREFYDKFNHEKIDEIHSKGKITPMEKAEEYLKLDVCAPEDRIGSASNRCEFFSDCYECILEYLSCNEEYDKFDFKLVNSYTPKKVKIKKML